MLEIVTPGDLANAGNQASYHPLLLGEQVHPHQPSTVHLNLKNAECLCTIEMV